MQPDKSATDEALQPLSQDLVHALVQNHREFRSFLSRRVSNEAIADEIFQQSLLKAIESQKTLEKEESVIPWFYRILRNSLIDYYRAHATEAKKYDGYLNELVSAEETASAPADELTDAICRCLKGLLPTLRPAYAEVIRRVDLDGEALDEVAKKLGLTLNNLSVRLHRAREAMRKSLVRTCGTCTEHACLDCTCK